MSWLAAGRRWPSLPPSQTNAFSVIPIVVPCPGMIQHAALSAPTMPVVMFITQDQETRKFSILRGQCFTYIFNWS